MWGPEAPIRITCRAVALQTRVVVRDGASIAGTIAHDNDMRWGAGGPQTPAERRTVMHMGYAPPAPREVARRTL